jgi:FG-GAP-like repeat
VQGRVLTVTPGTALLFGKYYTLVLSGIQDSLGNASTYSGSSNFTTTRGDPGRYAFPEALPAFTSEYVDLVRLVDMNGDGRPDLLASGAVSGGAPAGPVVVLRNADGTFSNQGTALPNERCEAADLSVIDLDADGRPDVMGARSFCGAFWIQQVGAGTWQYRGSFGFSGEQLRAIRLVGQVRPGIVGMGNFDPTLLVLRPRGGAGTTEFEAPEVLLPNVNTLLRMLQVADVNGDGREDIVMAPGSGGPILMFLQRADGSFERQSLSVPDIENVQLIADFNGDGRLDLLLSENYSSFGLVVQLQQADGRFSAPGQRYVLPARPIQALHADVDGDGRKEIVLTVSGPRAAIENLAAFVPRSDGSFTLLPLLQYPTLPRWDAALPAMPLFAVGDFSGDGAIDLLFRGELIRARVPFAVPASSRGGALRTLQSLVPAIRGRGH